MDVEVPHHHKKSKKTKPVESEELTKSKKVSKSDKHDKKKKDKSHKKDKKSSKQAAVIPTPVPEVNKKKRKAEAIEGDEKKKGSSAAETNGVEKVINELAKLSIPVDMTKLNRVKRHQPREYEELVTLMNGEKTKGIIYAYTVKTPIGRIFYYIHKEKRFRALRVENNLIKLVKYPKENTLNVAEIQKSLSDSQRKAALECIGLHESDIVTPENWLYAMIETGVIEREPEKASSTLAVESVLLHDQAKKQTYWLGSAKAKELFPNAVVTRTRTITDSNVDNEITALYNKRREILKYVEGLACITIAGTVTLSEPPPSASKPRSSEIASMKTGKDIFLEHTPEKKKKTTPPTPKKVVEQQPKTKKQKVETPPPQRLKATVASSEEDESESSDSYSSSSSSASESSSISEPEEKKVKKRRNPEESLKAMLKKKQKAGTLKVGTDPNGTTIAKSLEVKRNIEEALKHAKVIDDQMDPDIYFFRNNCGA